MNDFEQVRNFTESENPISEQFFREINDRKLRVEDIIPVTVYDQECMQNSNRNIINSLKITSAVLTLNFLVFMWFLMNIEKNSLLPTVVESIQPILNNFVFLESSLTNTYSYLKISTMVTWSVLTILLIIFLIKRNIDMTHKIESMLFHRSPYLKFDKQPVIFVDVVEVNAHISSYLKPLIIITALVTLQSAYLLYSNASAENKISDTKLEGQIGILVNHDTNYRIAMDQAAVIIKKKYEGPYLNFMTLQLLMKYKPLIDPVEFQSIFTNEFEQLDIYLKNNKSTTAEDFILKHPNFIVIKNEYMTL